MSVCYISTDSRLWGCGLTACPLLPSFIRGCFVPRCSEIYNWLYIYNPSLWTIWKSCMAFLENSEKNALAFVDIEGNIGSFAKLSLLFYTKEFIWKSLCSQSNYNLCYNPFVRTQLGKPIWNMLPPQTGIFSKGRWSYKTWCLIIIWSPYYVIKRAT